MPGLDRYVRPESEQFANISSGALTLKQWLELARRINTLFADDADLAGVVVTSGTDTLEETAYFLDLTVQQRQAGGRRRIDAQPEHARLRGRGEPARRIPRRGRARTRAARACSSCSTTRSTPPATSPRPTPSGCSTFQSRGYGVLGVVDSDRVVFYRSRRQAAHGGERVRRQRDRRAAARRRRHGLPGRVAATSSRPSWIRARGDRRSPRPARARQAGRRAKASSTRSRRVCSS